MRISDWSSDVCSSDLAGYRISKHYSLVTQEHGHGLEPAYRHKLAILTAWRRDGMQYRPHAPFSSVTAGAYPWQLVQPRQCSTDLISAFYLDRKHHVRQRPPAMRVDADDIQTQLGKHIRKIAQQMRPVLCMDADIDRIQRVARVAPVYVDESFRMPCGRSEEHTSELQSLMRISYAVFCLTKKTQIDN